MRYKAIPTPQLAVRGLYEVVGHGRSVALYVGARRFRLLVFQDGNPMVIDASPSDQFQGDCIPVAQIGKLWATLRSVEAEKFALVHAYDAKIKEIE